MDTSLERHQAMYFGSVRSIAGSSYSNAMTIAIGISQREQLTV